MGAPLWSRSMGTPRGVPTYRSRHSNRGSPTIALAMLAGGDVWPGGFGDVTSGIRWRTTTNDDKAAILTVSRSSGSVNAGPARSRPGAGTGHARPYLLRAHSLLDRNGAIDSPAFGRQLVHSTAEVRRPLVASGLLRLTGTAFVDVARAWQGRAPTAASSMLASGCASALPEKARCDSTSHTD